MMDDPGKPPPEVLAALLERVSEAVLITDTELDEPGPRILYANRAFEKMTGYRRDEVVGRSPRLLQGPETERAVLDRVRAALEAGESFAGHVTNYRKDGESFELEWRIEPFTDRAGRLQYFVALQSDATGERARQRYSDRLELLHRIYHDVSAQGLSLDRVRQGVADVALEMTEGEAAVVEEPEDNGMVYRAAVGTAAGHEGLRLPIDRSISGLAYVRQETLVCDDAETDERVQKKETARRIGFRSAVLTPLMHQGTCYGVLKVYSGTPNIFTHEDVQTLDLASGILAGALFDAAAFEEEVERRHLLLDAVPMLIAFIDTDRRYREVNLAHEAVISRSVAEMRGMLVWEVLGLENYERLRPYLDGALRGESVSFEVTFAGLPEGERDFRGRLEPHADGSDRVDGCYLAAQDFTDLRYADIDYLTGIFNRRKFEELGRYLLQSRERNELPLSLLMLDIDHFKNVNDTFGHSVGDDVLGQFAQVIAETLRKVDVACRWGGEEFAVLLHGANLARAEASADRLLQAIRAADFGAADGVTASIGVAEARGADTLRDVQERADQALYRAKKDGRDRVRTAQ